jgi:hypothetical protein
MTLTIEIPAGVSVAFKPATAGELEEDAGPFGDAPIGPAGWLELGGSDDPATNAILAQALEVAAAPRRLLQVTSSTAGESWTTLRKRTRPG